MRWTATGSWLGWMLLVTLGAGCFETRDRHGGETHFMRGCDVSCEAGLACVCGVCTQSCDQPATCEALTAGATCAAVDAGAQACGQMREQATVPARACVATCGGDADCGLLGEGFACSEGQCRERAMVSAPSVFVTHGCVGAACAVAEQPLVLLLVDTSGSMERKADCTCETPGCNECWPDCARAERNRWAHIIEALTGTFADFSCEQRERTAENGATFDLDYYMPHHAPRGVQGDDGLLDRYRDRVRFGLATFDSWDTYAGSPPLVAADAFDFERSAGDAGSWSYNPAREVGEALLSGYGEPIGSLWYPGCDTAYYMDTGVRGPHAAQGALRVAVDPSRADEVVDRIAADLLTVRPYGGTPMAAALDDLYYFMGADVTMAVERERPAAKHVVLITDGYPDEDYREVGCNCALEGDLEDPLRCGRGRDSGDRPWDPASMHCPYPIAEDAARALRCGRDSSCSGPAAAVHVIGFAIPQEDIAERGPVSARLDAIGESGGGGPARFAADGAALRAELEALIDELAP